MPGHSFIFMNQAVPFSTGELLDAESRAGRQGQALPVHFGTCRAIPSALVCPDPPALPEPCSVMSLGKQS